MMYTNGNPKPTTAAADGSVNKVIQELEMAMDLKKIEKVKELLGKLSKEDLTQQTGPLKLNILQKACASGTDIEIVRIVAEKYKATNVSLDIADVKNFTALDKAFLLRNDLVAKTLIRAGANYSRIPASSYETYLTNFLNEKSTTDRIEFEVFINGVEKERQDAKKSSWVGGLTYLYTHVIGASRDGSHKSDESDPETERLLGSTKSSKKKDG